MSHGTRVGCPQGTHRQKAWAPFLTPSPTAPSGVGFTPKPQCLAHRVCSVSVTGSQAHQHVGRYGEAHDAAQDSCPQERLFQWHLTSSRGITAMWCERGWHSLSSQTPGSTVTAGRGHRGRRKWCLTGETMCSLPSATQAGIWDPSISEPRLPARSKDTVVPGPCRRGPHVLPGGDSHT